MTVLREFMGRLFVALGVVLVVLCVWVSPVFAVSPWWHVSSTVRPTVLRSGVSKAEVQEITVNATGGFYEVSRPEVAEDEALLEAGSPVAVVKEALEGLYGAGNVEVGEAPGPPAENGLKPYLITFKGELTGRPVALIETLVGGFIKLSGGKEEVKATEVSKGATDGHIDVTAANLGDANIDGSASPVNIRDELPAGLKPISITGFVDGGSIGLKNSTGVTCKLESLSCTFTGTLQPYAQLEMSIGVTLENAVSGELNEANVTGGGAQDVTVKRPITVGEHVTPGGPGTPFGVEDYELVLEDEGGAPDTQAGSHPFQLTSIFDLNETGDAQPAALPKDLHFKLPSGLLGNPGPFAQCTLVQFLTEIGGNRNECPPATVVGMARITFNEPAILGIVTLAVPVFNLEPSVGEPARFGFLLPFTPVVIDTSVRSGEDYGITASVTNISQVGGFDKSEVTFWGVPGDPRHDRQRGWGCLEEARGVTFEPPLPCTAGEQTDPPPFLLLPTSCSGGPLQTSVQEDSWVEPENVLTQAGEPMQTLDGCNRLPFTPSIKVTPDGTAGSTPTGLTVDEHVPQESMLVAKGLAEANVKGLSATLPVGVAINPAGADGLQACSLEQIGLQSPGAPACPDASKVGTVRVKVPILSEQLEGAAYLGEQNANPFGSLVALYISAENAKEGVRVKATGEVVEDPVTGQLTAHFERDKLFANGPENTQYLPQAPFEDVELHFFGGDRAPLSTPSLCGSYTSTGTFTPWSGTPTTESSSTFNITTGPNATPCHNPLPFNPSLTAGTTSIQAGGFSPFTMTMSRPDGSQNLTAVKLRMPPGLLGTLATVKLCPQAQANAGTCGPESLIGHTTVSVGVGGDPFTVTGGQVFISEGYDGAPYGLSIVNPAKAGPFDLGQVVVRAKIEVDPTTAVLTITSDSTGPYKIPTILDGIPLQIQHVNVSIDRPNFTFNPTNCSPLTIGGSLTSDQGSVQALSVPFQITNCAVLAFKPKLTAKTNGKTSRANGASLSVKLTYPAGPFDANISKVKVDLPKQLPSRLTTLQKACPAKTFEANPAACPSASIVGHAKATTPVLPVGLEGPAYFVSHGGEEFPQLIIVLQGYGTTVHLVGSTFISKAGITSSTFKQVPDVPVGTFELTLPQGKFSALAANGNLCTTKKLAMPTSFIAQNGVVRHTTTPIVPTGCAKKKAHRAKGRSHEANHSTKGKTRK